jgi:hypothetical protein
MNQIQIDTQVEAIKKVTKDAVRSKASALQFLKDAGIVKKAVTPNGNQQQKKR